MRVFGGLRVRIDPWEVGYGSEFPLVPEEDAVSDVALDVEIPAGEWRAIEPANTVDVPKLVFVDGVRRIEARLIIRIGDRICHGAFGSYAVGSVVASNNSARWDDSCADHVVALGAGQTLPNAVSLGPSLLYRPVSTSSPDVDGPLQVIQDEMRLAEERLGRQLAEVDDDRLVVADGPLTFEHPVRGGAVGYIKRLFKLYVPERYLGLLASLEPGTRTPIFALRSTKRFARYAWFLRLVRPGAADSELSGIVRLEVSEAVGLETARRRADQTALLLPRFVPSRMRDPRAPQNLLPIGALESQLRRSLGDARLVRRRIESLIAAEGVNA